MTDIFTVYEIGFNRKHNIEIKFHEIKSKEEGQEKIRSEIDTLLKKLELLGWDGRIFTEDDLGDDIVFSIGLQNTDPVSQYRLITKNIPCNTLNWEEQSPNGLGLRCNLAGHNSPICTFSTEGNKYTVECQGDLKTEP